MLSGYTGGPEVGPSYQDVAYGRTGHIEAVIVYYDPAQVAYGELVEVFWRSMDSTDTGGQFADRGSQYRPGIFVASDAERAIAEQSKAALAASGRVVATAPASRRWPWFGAYRRSRWLASRIQALKSDGSHE